MGVRVERRSRRAASVRRSGRRRPSRPAAVAARAGRRTGSGRRIRCWREALSPEEGVGHAHQGDVMVPAAEGAALEVVEPQGVLHLAVVELDAPAQSGEAHEVEQARRLGKVAEPVLDRLTLALGPLGRQPGRRQLLPVGAPQAASSSSISSASCHLGRWRSDAGRCALVRRTSSSSRASGKKRRQSIGQLAASEAADTLTPIWQLPTLPRVPEY